MTTDSQYAALSPDQAARVSALRAAREVLARKSGGPFTSATVDCPDVKALHAIAKYILTGGDPWLGDAFDPRDACRPARTVAEEAGADHDPFIGASESPAPATHVMWWRNGDHPDDGCLRSENGSAIGEGKVVRYFRHPDGDGSSLCQRCFRYWNNHGWIDSRLVGGDGIVVCPGDLVPVVIPAKGDGVTDDTAAVQGCCASGRGSPAPAARKAP